MDSYVGAMPANTPRDGRDTNSGPHSQPAESHEAVLRVGQLARVLRRHLWLIALCTVVAAAAAFVYARTLPKTYTATSALSVEGDRFAIPELQGALRSESSPDPMPWVRTDAQALTARSMVQEVIAKLHLDQNPEFNAALRPPTLLQKIKTKLGSYLPKGSQGEASSGPDDLVYGAVSHAMAVFQDNRSLVISVAFTAQDPRLAADFVNTLMTDFVQSRAQRRSDADQSANTMITQRVEQVRADLSTIEQQMRDLRSKNEMVVLRAGGVSQQQLEELTTAAARAEVERAQIEVTYDRASAAAKAGSSDELAAVLNSPTVSALREQEGQAERRLAELSTRYGPEYPGMRSANAQLASSRRALSQEAARIVASLGAQLRVARGQEADIKTQLAKARQVGVVADNARAQLDQLQQEATTRRKLYQTLLEQAQQTIAQPTATRTPDVRVLSPAVAPGLPSGPNMKLAALMGGASGALLGCLIAVARLRSVDGLETADALGSATGLNVLATLPRQMIGRGRGVLAANGDSSGPDAEAMRALRGRMRFTGRMGTPRAILFTDAADQPAHAATALAAAFARVAAADGEHVLLLDGDLQAPSLRRLLGAAAMPPGDGGDDLTEVLHGADWRDAIIADQQPGLDLLLADGPTENAHALLNSVNFQNLLVETRAEYDLVVVVSPAATAADTGALVQRIDAAILVVDARVGHATTQDAATRLRSAARTTLAAILLT